MIFGFFSSLDITRARKGFKITTSFYVSRENILSLHLWVTAMPRFKVDIKDTNLKDGCSPPTDTLSDLSPIGVCCVGKLQTEL